MTSRVFAEHADVYWAKKLPAIPFKRGEKRPSITNWSRFSDHLLGDEERDFWKSKRGDHGIGLVMGAEVVPGKCLIGLDVDEGYFERAILGDIPGNPPVKRGQGMHRVRSDGKQPSGAIHHV